MIYMEALIHILKMALSYNAKRSLKELLGSEGGLHHQQSRFICSLWHCGHFLKISSKSVCNFLSYFGKRIDKETNACYQNHKLLGK